MSFISFRSWYRIEIQNFPSHLANIKWSLLLLLSMKNKMGFHINTPNTHCCIVVWSLVTTIPGIRHQNKIITRHKGWSVQVHRCRLPRANFHVNLRAMSCQCPCSASSCRFLGCSYVLNCTCIRPLNFCFHSVKRQTYDIRFDIDADSDKVSIVNSERCTVYGERCTVYGVRCTARTYI